MSEAFRFHTHFGPRQIEFTGMDDEICPYATFHLLGFREEMDPNKAGNQFQTFPHPSGAPPQQQDMTHLRQASQSMVLKLTMKSYN